MEVKKINLVEPDLNVFFSGAFSEAMGSQICVHLNKLTYSMYMVSPIAITVVFGLKETSSHFDEVNTVR